MKYRKPKTHTKVAISAHSVADGIVPVEPAPSLIEQAAVSITEKRVIAWHSACMAELVKVHGLDEGEASQVAMNLFDQHNGLKDYLSWQNADTVAQAWTPPAEEVEP